MIKIIKRVHSTVAMNLELFYIPPKCSNCKYYKKNNICVYFESLTFQARLDNKKCGLYGKKFEQK